MNAFTESVVEQAALDWFRALGYDVVGGPDMPPGPHALRESYADTIFPSVVRGALARLNPNLPADALDDAFRKLTRPEGPSLEARNRAFHRLAVDGVTVEYRRRRRLDSRSAGANVRLRAAVEQRLARRQSVHGSREQPRAPPRYRAVRQRPAARRRRAQEPGGRGRDPAQCLAAAPDRIRWKLPSLFTFNAVLAVSDGVEARLGTLTAGWEWFKPWRTISGEELAPVFLTQLQVAIEGAFEKRRFLALLRDFIVFEDDGGGRLAKKMAGYHQFHAVETAVGETLRAAELRVREERGRYESGRKPGGNPGDRRIGVVWHTQGSGKSLTMAFYAGRIIREPAMANPTVVVLTDRNDLDDQLFGTFARCRDLMRQPPVQADSRADLRNKLAVEAGGVVFSTIQKFLPPTAAPSPRPSPTGRGSREKGDRHPLLSERRNIVVIADEAHRSQYDFIDGFARHMRDALPNASFIGFTGTPIELQDANTRAVFGDYISIYDIQRAVEDRATVPIYYESRLAKLALDERERPRIDPGFEEATEGEEVDRKEKLKTRWAQLEAVVGAEQRIGLVAGDIVAHFEQRAEAMDGKAMVVCMSRRICINLYREFVRLRPGLARRGRRQGAHQGRHDRRGLRSARLAAAHPQQAPPGGAREPVPRPRRPASGGAGARHVTHRLRRAEPAHHVRRQADARPRADADDRACQPCIPGQAGRPRRRLSRARPRAQAGARDVYRERRHRPDRARPGRGGSRSCWRSTRSAAGCSTASTAPRG